MLRNAHDYLSHPDAKKSLFQLKNLCHWDNMTQDLEDYVKTCDTCQRIKEQTTLTPGKLHQLDTPDRPRQSISMDFMFMKCRSYDPLTKTTYDSVMVITDRLTRLAIIIPCNKTDDAKIAAHLFTREWFRRFGVPDEIISDRDPRFTSDYWKKFTDRLGIQCKLSSAYHPQTDGATERVNRSILQILRADLINKCHKEWFQMIPEVEFSYNARLHSSIGMTPFQAQYGYIPSYGDYKSSLQRLPITERVEKITHTLKRKRNTQEMQYNKKHKTADQYEIGDLVSIDTQHFRKTDPVRNLSEKLHSRYQGPYPIKEILPKETYRLELPETTKMHNAFHTSVLKPYWLSKREKYPERDKEEFRPGPVDPEEPDVYSLEQILNHAYRGRRPGKLHFHVLWKGYPPEQATWELGTALNEDTPVSVRNYLRSLSPQERKTILKDLS